MHFSRIFKVKLVVLLLALSTRESKEEEIQSERLCDKFRHARFTDNGAGY
jgi:hypothetical protein